MSEAQEDPSEPLSPASREVRQGPPDRTFQPSALCIPWLHPELEALALPEEVLFFDPWGGNHSAPRTWRPDTLPLSVEAASAFLRESAAFARERGQGRSILDGSALAGNDFYTGSALAIQSQLTGGPGTGIGDDPALRCQQILLLAWQLEEQALELRALEQRINAGWQDLDQALGIEESGDNFEPDGHQAFSGERFFTAPIDQEPTLPWRLVLEAMLFFIPQGTLLITSCREIADSLTDVPGRPKEELPGPVAERLESFDPSLNVKIVHTPGWQLAGKPQCPADRTWLDSDRFLLIAAPDEKGKAGNAA